MIRRRPKDVPLHHWPWAYVVLINMAATIVLFVAGCRGAWT